MSRHTGRADPADDVTPAPFAPGDFVVILDREAPYALGMVHQVHDDRAENRDGAIFFWMIVPAEAPHPYTAEELRAATDEDKAAHHPSWVRWLAEDWARQQGRTD